MNAIKNEPDTRDNHEHTDTVSQHNIEALQYIQVLDGNYLRLLEAYDAPGILEIFTAVSSIRNPISVTSKMHEPGNAEDQVDLYKQDRHLIRYVIVKSAGHN